MPQCMKIWSRLSSVYNLRSNAIHNCIGHTQKIIEDLENTIHVQDPNKMDMYYRLRKLPSNTLSQEVRTTTSTDLFHQQKVLSYFKSELQIEAILRNSTTDRFKTKCPGFLQQLDIQNSSKTNT